VGVSSNGSQGTTRLGHPRQDISCVAPEITAISVPLFALAAIFTGLLGVIAVCVALVLLALVSGRS